jgi:phosphatidylglycerol lysyltransferase
MSCNIQRNDDVATSRNGLNRRQRRRFVTQSRWAIEQKLNQPEDSFPLTERTRLLEAHGNFSLAYSTAVQPLLSYFGDDSGYLAFRQRWGVTFVLGDPVADSQRCPGLLKEFVSQYPISVFCQISHATAKSLESAGYLINDFGVDTSLRLAEYSLAGKEKEWLRYASNWVQRRGYQIQEADYDTIAAEEVEQLSEAWRKTRTVKRKEVRFLNRPIVLEPEKDVRRFFLISPEGKLEAFIFFDPLYSGGQITGYVTTFKRRHPESTQYAEQAIMKWAIEQFKSERIHEIKLGLSPCAWIENRCFENSSWFASKLMNSMFESKMINRYAYNLVGHAQYKRRFRGVEEKTYFASRSRVPLRSLAALIGLCGIA